MCVVIVVFAVCDYLRVFGSVPVAVVVGGDAAAVDEDCVCMFSVLL